MRGKIWWAKPAFHRKSRGKQSHCRQAGVILTAEYHQPSTPSTQVTKNTKCLSNRMSTLQPFVQKPKSGDLVPTVTPFETETGYTFADLSASATTATPVHSSSAAGAEPEVGSKRKRRCAHELHRPFACQICTRVHLHQLAEQARPSQAQRSKRRAQHPIGTSTGAGAESRFGLVCSSSAAGRL